MLARIQGLAQSSTALEAVAHALGSKASELKRNLSFRIDDGDGTLRIALRGETPEASQSNLVVILRELRTAYNQAIFTAADASVAPLKQEEQLILESLKTHRSGASVAGAGSEKRLTVEDLLLRLKSVRSEIQRKRIEKLAEADGWFVYEQPTADQHPKRKPLFELPLAAAILVLIILTSLRLLLARSFC
jgi:hypothetical protein